MYRIRVRVSFHTQFEMVAILIRILIVNDTKTRSMVLNGI